MLRSSWYIFWQHGTRTWSLHFFLAKIFTIDNCLHLQRHYFVISFCWAVWSSLLSSALVLDQCQVGLLSPIISHWSTTTIIRLPTAWCLAWKNAPLSYNMGRSDTSKGIGTRTPTSIEKSIFQQILVEKNFHLVEMQIELLSRNLLFLSIIRL
jgi:hypothetical protein